MSTFDTIKRVLREQDEHKSNLKQLAAAKKDVEKHIGHLYTHDGSNKGKTGGSYEHFYSPKDDDHASKADKALTAGGYTKDTNFSSERGGSFYTKGGSNGHQVHIAPGGAILSLK